MACEVLYAQANGRNYLRYRYATSLWHENVHIGKNNLTHRQSKQLNVTLCMRNPPLTQGYSWKRVSNKGVRQFLVLRLNTVKQERRHDANVMLWCHYNESVMLPKTLEHYINSRMLGAMYVLFMHWHISPKRTSMKDNYPICQQIKQTKAALVHDK